MIINYLFGFLSMRSGVVLPVLAAGALAFNVGQRGVCEVGGSDENYGEVNFCVVEGESGMERVTENEEMVVMEDRIEMEWRIEVAVRRQMERYPESRLIDYYKNFFQDKFGPGHMVRDTASAGAYLRRELALVSAEMNLKPGNKSNISDESDIVAHGDLAAQRDKAQSEGVSKYLEFTGWEERFVRADLRLISEGLVSYSEFFESFIASVSQAEQIDLEKWIEEWQIICRVIKRVNPDVPGFDEESKKIVQMLERGDYVVHHSEEYNKRYRPHYRLIKRELFSRYLGPSKTAAQHSIPSSRPTKPNLSVVVALTDI